VTTPRRAIVKSAGTPIGLSARYTQTLLTQMAQAAVCICHHSLDQQLCRWLLISLDRLSTNRLTKTQELTANILAVSRECVTQAARKLQGLKRHPPPRPNQRPRPTKARSPVLQIVRGGQEGTQSPDSLCATSCSGRATRLTIMKRLLGWLRQVFADVANLRLDFAQVLFDVALHFERRIAHDLASYFLDRAFRFVDAALNLIFVDAHLQLLSPFAGGTFLPARYHFPDIGCECLCVVERI
jgi:hypothetical protein